MALNLLDITTNHNDLTNIGATDSSDTPFVASTDSAALASASQQYLKTTSYSATYEPSSLTIEAWIKPVAVNVRGDIVAHNSSAASFNASYLFTLGLTNSKVSGYFQNGSAGVNIDSTSSITAGVWTHVALTYDGTTAKIYINGNSTADNTLTLNEAIFYSGSNLLSIGANIQGGGPEQYFNGNIDEVRVWNTIRTGVQINANYNIRLTGSESGLVAYYPFETLSSGGRTAAGSRTNSSSRTNSGARTNSGSRTLV